MATTKNLCAQIPIDLHERVSEERERLGLTTSEYIVNLIQDYYNMMENQKGGIQMTEKGRTMAFQILINPSGRFVEGGFEADTGLTGRKLMVDTYGGLAPHGGGALSGKDGTKVDRSGAYMARYIAKNVVAAGIAKECTVSLAYAIGKAQPVMVEVDTHGTGKFSDNALEQAICALFDLTPDGMIRTLGLDKPIFRQLCNYGHFTHEQAPWEQTNMAEPLECACRAKEAGVSQR